MEEKLPRGHRADSDYAESLIGPASRPSTRESPSSRGRPIFRTSAVWSQYNLAELPSSHSNTPRPARVPAVRSSPDWQVSALFRVRCPKTLWIRTTTKVILLVTKPDNLWVASETALPEPWKLKTVISSVSNLSEPWVPVEPVLPEPFESRSLKLMIRENLEIRELQRPPFLLTDGVPFHFECLVHCADSPHVMKGFRVFYASKMEETLRVLPQSRVPATSLGSVWYFTTLRKSATSTAETRRLHLERLRPSRCLSHCCRDLNSIAFVVVMCYGREFQVSSISCHAHYQFPSHAEYDLLNVSWPGKVTQPFHCPPRE